MLIQAVSAAPESLWMGDEDRLLVVAPHPDDETLTAGGLIQEAVSLDLPVRVCMLSMGDNDEIASMFIRRHPAARSGAIRSTGTLRGNEALRAAVQLGLSTNDLVFLGYPDAGMLDIWTDHWRDTPPFESLLTDAVQVESPQALSPGAPYTGESMLQDLTDVIREFKPTLIVMPHAADQHPDHRAAALFTRVALWNLEPYGIDPVLLAAPVHFCTWPTPREAETDLPASSPPFLDPAIQWRQYSLAPYQVSNKVAALRRYHSQMDAAPAFLLPFIRKTEIFGGLPELNFPGGEGSAELAEEDTSQYRPDPKAFSLLDSASAAHRSLQEQQQSEQQTLGKDDNDFLMETLTGDGAGLTLEIQFLNPLSGKTTLTVSFFSWQDGIPFATSPKLSIEVRNGRMTAVRDLDELMDPEAVRFSMPADDTVRLQVPYALLGDPDRILFSCSLARGSLPIDWTPWRIVDLWGTGDLSGSVPPVVKPDAVSEPPWLPSPVPARRGPAPAPVPPVEAVRPAVSPVVEQPVPEPEPGRKMLVPRVRIPARPQPEHRETDEPVLW